MNLAEHIRGETYLRERLQPQPGDSSYLHLSDLRQAMEGVRTTLPLRLLDYGCGGSPYRSLFPHCNYRRADYLQNEGDPLDYIVGDDSRVDEKDDAFDFILSTQVLEHVGQPQVYLKECFRLLKSGGKLYLTTHGTYPDHGCPYDFYRWTAEGLAREVQEAGFIICRMEKQTTGPRAFFMQCDYQCHSLIAPRRTLFGFFLYVFRRLYARLQPWVHRMCDTFFSGNRVVAENLENHTTYAVVACLAQKA
jgi:SAM-dependent methyltransferase